MSLTTSFICEAALAINTAIISHEAEIESLDRAIGDGDHYINIKRGAASVIDMLDALRPLTPDAALQQIGMKLLSAVGGASGPLLASFFIGMAALIKHNGGKDNLSIAAAFAAGVQGIMQRGKANLGEKTMLDVLIPVANCFTTQAAAGQSRAAICADVQQAATAGLMATRDLLATKGRAASLGERSRGHLDAGAKSCQVMIEAVCTLLNNQ